MNVAIIGGGAAGFFSALAVKENHPHARVTVFEKSQKLLAKVKVSGGGRCNVTNGCSSVSTLCEAYPRGGKKLKKAFHRFNTTHTMQWFESRGVPLIVEDDQRVFPASHSSQSIIDCFINEARKLGVAIKTGTAVSRIKVREDQRLQLDFRTGTQPTELFDKVIVASGGSPKRSGLQWLEDLGHHIESPVPSLFTFNMPAEAITQLMGVVGENTLVQIQGTKLKSQGPLLITHWGMSGPAVLKLSAFGARQLSAWQYNFKVQVNWVNEINNEVVKEKLTELIARHPKKILANLRPFSLPERLWLFLLEKRNIAPGKRGGELGAKALNQLVSILTNDVYTVSGKTTFKEEFVSCGGVSLQSIDMNTMQSKACANLYFAGEVLDIDAITGGYNFQAAWTTGFIAGQLQ